MPFTHFALSEEDILRLILEFCSNRKLHIAQLSLERETGIINGDYSDDMLFLRQLILDGQWDDVLDFIQPLDALPSFNLKHFTFLILQQKFIELLCVRNEASQVNGNSNMRNGNTNNNHDTVDEVVRLLGELERLAPTKEAYSNLCLLLTTPRLTDHLLFKNWNPSASRYQCFLDIFPLVKEIMQSETNKVFLLFKSHNGVGVSYPFLCFETVHGMNKNTYSPTPILLITEKLKTFKKLIFYL